MAPTLNAIGLVVADMAKSLAFYRRLGVDVAADAERAPHAEAQLGGIKLMWDTYDTITSFDPDWTPGSGGPRNSLAFLCTGPAEVDATYADMVAAGHDGHRAPWDAPWGQRYAVLRDPDGNGVDLYAPLPT
jgi:catechol 2,3-dioxygenase-like lactoylglutathione lyase family enzyme